jgi:RNA polymerase sigma-70 factor, ECF subfamily
MAGTAARVGSDDGVGLVDALRSGDEQAFAALVDGWSGWMLRLAHEHVASHTAAEDVVQETWLAVLRGLDGFRGDASLRTWIYRILVNQAKRRGVGERRTVPFASLTSEDDGPTVDPTRFRGADDQYPGGWRSFPDQWPERMTLTRELHEVVAVALTGLPDRQRLVVALRDLDGLTSAEVCDLLDISAGNQRVLLHRGRAAVRTHLELYLAGSPTAPQPAPRSEGNR